MKTWKPLSKQPGSGIKNDLEIRVVIVSWQMPIKVFRENIENFFYYEWHQKVMCHAQSLFTCCKSLLYARSNQSAYHFNSLAKSATEKALKTAIWVAEKALRAEKLAVAEEALLTEHEIYATDQLDYTISDTPSVETGLEKTLETVAVPGPNQLWILRTYGYISKYRLVINLLKM